MSFSFGRRPVAEQPDPVTPYEELLDRIKFGAPPRPKRYQVKRYGPVTVEHLSMHGYGRRCANMTRKPRGE